MSWLTPVERPGAAIPVPGGGGPALSLTVLPVLPVLPVRRARQVPVAWAVMVNGERTEPADGGQLVAEVGVLLRRMSRWTAASWCVAVAGQATSGGVAGQATSDVVAGQATSGGVAGQATSDVVAGQATSGVVAGQATSDAVARPRSDAVAGRARSDVVFALVQRLADIAADAEREPRRRVPWLGEEMLPDQLTVVAHDVLRTEVPAAWRDGLATVRATRAALFGR